MHSLSAAHQRFVDFVAEFYRDAGCELPHFETDSDTPIAFEVEVGGVALTVGYDPLADASLFVHCVFGAAPPHEEAAVLRRLLERNLSQAREHNATYCMDARTRQVSCYLRKAMVQVDVAQLQDELARVAQQAVRWRADYFAADGEASDQAEPPATWAVWA